MKIFHTSDWHLGRLLYGKSLMEDQRYFLHEIFLKAVEREKPACVIIAGDLYDRQIAPPEAIALLDSTLSRLMELEIPVCAISGNHDGGQRIALLKNALRRSGVYISTEIGEAFSPVLIEKDGQRAQIFLLPYFDTAQARDYLGDDSLRGESACMKRIIDNITPLFMPGAAHILVSHCFAAGSQTSDSESSLFVGGSGEVATSLFAPFDYAALGHLHGMQRAGEKGWYSGSPLKYSVDEAKQEKCFISLEWDGSSITTRPVPITPLRDVRRISGRLEELLRQGEAKPCGDYAELALEDKEPVLMAAERLRPYYPNLLTVSNSWVAGAVSRSRTARLKGQDESTIFSSFLKEVCQYEAEEEDLALFREILKEVRP